MSKRISKLLSMLLAAVMVLSMAMTGLAATITINNSSNGETYNAYKIFDVTLSADYDKENGTGYSYTIDSTSPWFTAVSAAAGEDGVFTLIRSDSSTTYYVTVNEEVDDEDVIAVFTNAVTYIVDEDEGKVLYIGDKKLTADATGKADGKTAILIVNDPGYYFVTTTLGSVVMIDTADAALTINEKNDVPTPGKKILVDEETDDLEDTESVDNTKTVTYVLYANNVRGAVNLVIHDQMDVDPSMITYTFDYNNMTVELYDKDDTFIKTLGTGLTSDYYNVEYPTDPDKEGESACDFHIIFSSTAEALFSSDECPAGSYVKVTISCELNAGENAFVDDEVDIPNKEKVTYGNDGDSEWEVVDVYEYGFEIYKYTGGTEGDEGLTGETPLAGAQFELTNSADQKAYFEYDEETSNYLLEGWGEIPTEPENNYTSVIETDSNGKANIEGLAEGTYTLTEIKAPDGYNMLEDVIEVTIAAGEENKDTFTVNSSSDHTVYIVNNAGTKLPGTGGMGTTLFYIVGIVLVLGAAVLFVTKKRLDRE